MMKRKKRRNRKKVKNKKMIMKTKRMNNPKKSNNKSLKNLIKTKRNLITTINSKIKIKNKTSSKNKILTIRISSKVNSIITKSSIIKATTIETDRAFPKRRNSFKNSTTIRSSITRDNIRETITISSNSTKRDNKFQ